jgi:uncharacterized damage-inducible protein DinB
MKKQVDLLWEYNYWANHRLLMKAENLTEVQLREKSSYMWDSMLRTMAHVLGAEWSWRQRIQEGVSPAAIWDRDQFSTLEMLKFRWEEEETSMRAYLGGLNDADLERVVHSKNRAGKVFSRPLWHILNHVVNHGSQHRSETALYLTNFGQSPGDMDFLIFVDERSS